MSAGYIDLKNNLEEVKTKLDTCAADIDGIEPAHKTEYPEPQLRLWSGDIKDLGSFAIGLEEWLSQPLVAEAKRYLSDLRKWTESTEKISPDAVEKDWKFLSDSVHRIKEIHTKIGEIEFDIIKKKVSSFALGRINGKDIDPAENWATNANKFSVQLKPLKDMKVESKLAQEVKADTLKELLKKIVSFDKDNIEAITKYRGFLDKSENVVKNKPLEIKEQAIIKTYGSTDEIEESLSRVDKELGRIRKSLIDLEWVKEHPELKDHNDYGKLLEEKRKSILKDDLKNIADALQSAQQKAVNWKEARRTEIDNAFTRIERMLKSVEKDFKKQAISIEEKKRGINWNKPDLTSILEVQSQIDQLRNQSKKELINKLKNEDSISMIEEPEIVEDLGKKKGWDFERFIKGLEIVLKNGLIEIKAVEEE